MKTPVQIAATSNLKDLYPRGFTCDIEEQTAEKMASYVDNADRLISVVINKDKSFKIFIKSKDVSNLSFILIQDEERDFIEYDFKKKVFLNFTDDKIHKYISRIQIATIGFCPEVGLRYKRTYSN